MRAILSFVFTIIISSAFAQLNIPVKGQSIVGDLLDPESKTLCIIIAGSGPTDKDGNSKALQGNNNSLLYLAEYLDEIGVASFRYDKRGLTRDEYPPVNEKDLRFDDYVQDAIAVFEYFKAKNKYDKIGFIGHSEGSLIGLLAAKKVNPDFVISLCGLGSPAFEPMKLQMAQLPELLRIEAFGYLYKLALGDTLPEVNPQLNTLFRSSVQPYLISWFKYNPAKEIESLQCPILVIQGTHDIQVELSEGKKLQQANKQVTLVDIKEMNHVLKTAPLERLENIATYTNPDIELHPKLKKELDKFLLKL